MEKGLVLCITGNTAEYFDKTGLGASMRKVFLDDRLFDRVKFKNMIIIDETSRECDARELNRLKHLQMAFETGLNF